MRDFTQEIDDFRARHKKMYKEVNGVNFSYWLSGQGEFTYVLLPGGMGAGEFFYKHILALEKVNRVLTIDYPEKLRDNNRLADGIISLIESLDLQNPVFIGQSYGGMIAQVIAKRHPEKTVGLVLSNTGTATDKIIPGDKKLAKMIAGQRMGIKIVRFVPYSWIKKAMRKKLLKYLNAVDEQYRPYLTEIFDAMLAGYTKDRYLLMTGLLLDFHTRQRFTKQDFTSLKTKPLLIFSPDDHTFSEGVRKELISLMPSSVTYCQLKGGHLSIILQADQFTQVITEYQWRHN